MGIPRQPYRKVHSEQLDDAMQLYNSGMSLRAPSKQLGVSPGMLRSQITEAGITIRGRGRRLWRRLGSRV